MITLMQCDFASGQAMFRFTGWQLDRLMQMIAPDLVAPRTNTGIIVTIQPEDLDDVQLQREIRDTPQPERRQQCLELFCVDTDREE